MVVVDSKAGGRSYPCPAPQLNVILGDSVLIGGLATVMCYPRETQA